MPPGPEAPTAAAAPARGGRGSGQIFGMDKRTVYIGGAVFVVVLVYLVWRNKKQQATSGSNAPSECTDSQGNPVPCTEAGGIDYSGQLSAIQTELESLAAAQGGAGSGGGSSGTGGWDWGSGGGGSTTGTTGTGQTGSGGGATGGTASSGGGGAPKQGPPPAPGGVHATAVSASSVTLAWNKVAGATSYRVRVTYQSQLVKQTVTPATTVVVSGLGADHTYGFHVASENAAGTGPEGDTDIKTSR